MEIDEIRGLTNDELSEELGEANRAFMNLRFRVATMQLANVNEIKNIRRRIARINTVMRERELARSGR